MKCNKIKATPMIQKHSNKTKNQIPNQTLETQTSSSMTGKNKRETNTAKYCGTQQMSFIPPSLKLK